jgi:exocyst complex component 4
MRLSGLETAGSPMEAETLRDLFWTVYAKLHAVVEGHRVVYEIINRISSVRFVLSDTRKRRTDAHLAFR